MCFLFGAKKNRHIDFEMDLVSTKNIWLGMSYCFCLFDLLLYVSVNNFSVMLGWFFQSWTSTKQRIKCLAQGHKAVAPVRPQSATPDQSQALYQWATKLQFDTLKIPNDNESMQVWYDLKWFIKYHKCRKIIKSSLSYLDLQNLAPTKRHVYLHYLETFHFLWLRIWE